MAAAAAAGALVSGGSNIVASGITAGLQIYGNSLNNQQQYNNTLGIAKYAESAYTEAGLPRYMAWGGNSNSLPGTQYHIGGGNFYGSGPVNSNLPMYTTNYSQMAHASTPRPSANFDRESFEHLSLPSSRGDSGFPSGSFSYHAENFDSLSSSMSSSLSSSGSTANWYLNNARNQANFGQLANGMRYQPNANLGPNFGRIHGW